MRKLSSSNESTTSEAPSNSSDHQAMLPPTSNLLGSPSSFVHSPPSIVVGGVGAIPTTSLLLSSVSKEPPHFKSEVVEGESDVVSKMHADMLGAGPLSPIQVQYTVHVQCTHTCTCTCSLYSTCTCTTTINRYWYTYTCK